MAADIVRSRRRWAGHSCVGSQWCRATVFVVVGVVSGDVRCFFLQVNLRRREGDLCVLGGRAVVVWPSDLRSLCDRRLLARQRLRLSFVVGGFVVAGTSGTSAAASEVNRSIRQLMMLITISATLLRGKEVELERSMASEKCS